MADRREAILARLVAVAGTVPGVSTALRNVEGLSEGRRPAVIVLDADEAVDDMEVAGSRPFDAPTIVMMTPEMFILVSKAAASVGAELNALRCGLIRRVLQDPILRDRVGRNGEIRYGGCVTTLATGRTMEGEMALSFTFRYALRPAELEDV